MKLSQKLGFIEILRSGNPILDPGTWIGMKDESNWVKSLPDPQFVCIKPIKPMKTHFKTHKIGQNWVL